MEEQCTQGTFIPSGRQDILTTAIGRPEHPGRVRAVGQGVGVRHYFGPPSQDIRTSTSLSQEDIAALEMTLTEKLTPAIRAKLEEELTPAISARLEETITARVQEQLLRMSSMGTSFPDAHPPSGAFSTTNWIGT